MDATDQELLDAARAGDTAALETLLERYQGTVYRFGMKMCRHPEDAEDVLQETLLAAARSVREFRGASSLSTWLYTIARSFCVKKRRKSKFAPEQQASLETDVAREAATLADPGRAPDEEAAGQEVQRALEAAIRALDPEQREVLVLRDVEGLPAKEVAEVVGISVAATKSRLHRARKRLRELVAPILETPVAEAPTGCPDVLTLYSKNLEGEIEKRVCEEMERHLETCEHCRTSCDALKKTLAMCNRLPSRDVPEDVQISVRKALRAFLLET